MRTSCRLSSVVAIVFIGLSLNARAQYGPNWKFAGKLPFYPKVVYFSDTKHGVAAAWGNTYPMICYTTDGITWQGSAYQGASVYPDAIRNYNDTLYAAMYSGTVEISTDNGATWKYGPQPITKTPDLYFKPNGQLAGTPFPPAPNLQVEGSFARADALHCIFTIDDSYSPYISSDGGVTWSLVYPGIRPRGGFGTFGDSCAHILIYCSESDSLYRSTDYGATWTSHLNMSEDLLEGKGGILYTGNQQGIYRSSDYGTTWVLIGGPPLGYEDMHFAVFGALGQNVAVPAPDSTIWMTTNGGDGTMPDPLTPDTIRVIASCSGARIQMPITAFRGQMSVAIETTNDSLGEFTISGRDSLYFSNPGNSNFFLQYSPKTSPGTSSVTLKEHVVVHCSDEFATRVVMVTVPPTAKIASTSLSGSCSVVQDNCTAHLDPCQSIVITTTEILPASFTRLQYLRVLPDTITNSTGTQIPITFDPRDTIFNGTVTLHVTGYYLGTTIPFDTTIPIKLTASHISAKLLSSVDSIASTNVDFCGAFDTAVTYRNSGCDAITVLQQLDPIAPDWIVNGPTLPLRLPPDSAFEVRFHCSPNQLGPTKQTVTYSFDQPVVGTTTTTTISATANITYSGIPLVVSVDTVHLGTRSFCDGDTAVSMPFSNEGCDSARYTIQITGNKYVLESSPDTALAGFGNGSTRIRFGSNIKGDHSGAITIHAQDSRIPALTKDTTIYFTAHVGDGTRILETANHTIDFGTTRICEDRDTSITITNTGCDTVTLDRADIQDAGFVLSPTPSFPIIIDPGKTATFGIHTVADTTGHVNNRDGMMQFKSNSLPELSPITFTRAFHYAGSFGLSLTSPAVTQVEKTVNLQVKRTGVIPPEASSIDFAITCNEDALSYLSVAEADVHEGATQVLSSGLTERHFTMSPATDRDVLATLSYHSYLNRSDSAWMTVSQPSVHVANAAIPSDCIASIDTSATNTALLLQCGQDVIQQLLRTGSFDLSISRADASSNALNFQLSKHCEQIEYNIFDLLGRNVQSGELANIRSGTIPIGSLAQGAYLLRVKNGSFSASRAFSVVR